MFIPNLIATYLHHYKYWHWLFYLTDCSIRVSWSKCDQFPEISETPPPKHGKQYIGDSFKLLTTCFPQKYPYHSHHNHRQLFYQTDNICQAVAWLLEHYKDRQYSSVIVMQLLGWMVYQYPFVQLTKITQCTVGECMSIQGASHNMVINFMYEGQSYTRAIWYESPRLKKAAN